EVSDIMCKGGLGTISLDNFQYDPNDPFTLELYEGSNATPVYTEQLSSIPFNGYLIDQSKYELTENQYWIRLVQTQSSVGCTVESAMQTFRINGPADSLRVELGEVKISLPDQPTGSIQLKEIMGGTTSYYATVELIDPLFSDQSLYIAETPVERNPSSLKYDVTFENLYAGEYEVYVRDENACDTTLIIRIDYDKSIFIPNVFTPNG